MLKYVLCEEKMIKLEKKLKNVKLEIGQLLQLIPEITKMCLSLDQASHAVIL